MDEQELDAYKQMEDQEKVVYNLNEIINLINNHEFTNIYNKLDKTFRNAYFKTEQDFREYIENKLFKVNYINDIKITQESEVYRCYCTLKDSNRVAANIANITFYMVIEEDGYVLSIDMIN